MTCKSIPVADLGNPATDEERFRAVHKWAVNNKFVGGFPTFHRERYGTGVQVYGAVLFTAEAAECLDVEKRDLREFSSNEERFRSIDQWASDTKVAAAFPNFIEDEDSTGIMFGTIVLKAGAVLRKLDISEHILRMHTTWTFSDDITSSQRLRSLAQHARGFDRVITCGNLEPQEKADVLAIYQTQVIDHQVNHEPGVNARGGGRVLHINFNVLFPQGDDEIAQTLIHELMHCAGYRHGHITRTSTPEERSVYYNTAPLRAELCIAGRQSLQTSERVCTCKNDSAWIIWAAQVPRSAL